MPSDEYNRRTWQRRGSAALCGSFFRRVVPGNVVSQDPAAQASLAPGASVSLVVSQEPVLPPDPSTVAPPIDTSVASTVGVMTAFLYSGANPV
jgi:hypothetical protein